MIIMSQCKVKCISCVSWSCPVQGPISQLRPNNLTNFHGFCMHACMFLFPRPSDVLYTVLPVFIFNPFNPEPCLSAYGFFFKSSLWPKPKSHEKLELFRRQIMLRFTKLFSRISNFLYSQNGNKTSNLVNDFQAGHLSLYMLGYQFGI